MSARCRRRRSLRTDRSAATALEFALVFPCLMLFIFSFIAIYSMFAARRAIDFGTERALRYAAVHSGTSLSSLTTTVFNPAASTVWRTVGVTSTVTYTTTTSGVVNASPTTFAVGDTLALSVAYQWGAPAFINIPYSSTVLIPINVSSTASIRILN